MIYIRKLNYKNSGITFINLKNDSGDNYLLGDSEEYIKARELLKNRDYNKILSSKNTTKKYILENGAEVSKNEIDEKYCHTCKYSHLPKKDYANNNYVNDDIYKNYCYDCSKKDKYIKSTIIHRNK